MSVINPETVSDILRECSERYILPRYNKLLDAEILTKTGPSDLVTQADLDVEEHLNRVLLLSIRFTCVSENYWCFYHISTYQSC